MTDTDPTAGMSDAELAQYYNENGLADFEGGEVVNLDPGPKGSIVSVRFAAGELDAVEQQAETAGMKLTAYIRASALSGARVVDLDRLRKVAAKLVADIEEMGKVFDLPIGRPTTRRLAKSAHSSRLANGGKSGRATTSKRAASKATAAKAPVKSAAGRASKSADASALNQSRKAPTKKAATSKTVGRPAERSSAPKGKT